MTNRVLKALSAAALLLLPIGGCVVATDLLNPGVLTAFGLDPATVIRPAGRTLVTFNNTSGFDASFEVAVSDDPADPTANATFFFSEFLRPNQTQTAAFDCPIGVLTPGTPSADFSTDTVAVSVVTAAGLVTVNYTGAPLVAGVDFLCGDLVEMRLVQTGVDAMGVASFGIQMRVVPGR